MKKHSAFYVALSAVATIALLVACGSGDLIDPSAGEERNKIITGVDDLKNLIESGVLDTITLSSSSSDAPIQSSSSEGETVSSSSVNGGTSSGGNQPSSSSKQSSSSSMPETPGNTECSGNASCCWDRESVLPGQTIKPLGTANSWTYKDATGAFAEAKQLPANGISAATGKTYFLFADGNACVPTAGLKVSAAPTLTGTCAWSKNPTSSAKGATPGGVTFTDADKICGANAKIAWKYNGGAAYPADGIVPAGTHSDVQATVDCPAYPLTSITCPALTVNAGADNTLSDVDTYVTGIESGSSMDMDFAWDNAGYHPEIYVRCDADPAFAWGETVNLGKKGFVKVCYDGTCDTQNGDYGVSAKVLVVSSAQSQAYEFSGATVDLYIADENGTNQVEAAGHNAKCKISVNGN